MVFATIVETTRMERMETDTSSNIRGTSNENNEEITNLFRKAGCNFSTDPFDVCVRRPSRFHSVENTASVTGVASRDVEFLPLLSFNYLRKLPPRPRVPFVALIATTAEEKKVEI